MDNYSEQSAERLREIQADLERQYAGYQARSLKLDMSRGKPSGSQLDLTNGILDRLDGYMVEGGIDARNYGCLEGIHEARKLFSELLGGTAVKLGHSHSSDTVLDIDGDRLSELYTLDALDRWETLRQPA